MTSGGSVLDSSALSMLQQQGDGGENGGTGGGEEDEDLGDAIEDYVNAKVTMDQLFERGDQFAEG